MLLTPSWLEKVMTYFLAQKSDPIDAASGHDPAMAEELRVALVAAALSYAEALSQAASAESWTLAARRLAGLAASFGAHELHKAGRSALAAPWGDAAAVALVEGAIAQLHGSALQIS